MWAAIQGRLSEITLQIKTDYAVCVVIAAKGYPGRCPKGEPIVLPPVLPPGTWIMHAGTALDDRRGLISAGGRVLESAPRPIRCAPPPPGRIPFARSFNSRPNTSGTTLARASCAEDDNPRPGSGSFAQDISCPSLSTAASCPGLLTRVPVFHGSGDPCHLPNNCE